MSYIRQIKNLLKVGVITATLCIVVKTQSDSRHNFQVQAQSPTPSPTASSTASPTASPTASLKPTPTRQSPLSVNNRISLILPKRRWWKTTDPSEQIYALYFEPVDNSKKGLLTIWYKYNSGFFKEEIQYKLVDKEKFPNKLYPTQNENEWIDIFMSNNKVIHTIFKIVRVNAKPSKLSIQLKGLKPNKDRPKEITSKGERSFIDEPAPLQ